MTTAGILRSLTFVVTFTVIAGCVGRSGKPSAPAAAAPAASSRAADPNGLNAQARQALARHDYAAALPLLREAAGLGQPESEFNLSVCYRDGLGTASNPTESARWLRLAAEAGWPDALFQLGHQYAEGQGVEKNLSEAHRWFSKAAEAGDAEAQFVVAGQYLDGVGVPKDVEKGLLWARRLALREGPENLSIRGRITSARLNLALVYLEGRYGVHPDPDMAYRWFLIANESKRAFSSAVQGELLQSIQKLEKSLTAQQLASSRRAAEAILGRPLQNYERRGALDL
jgi:TPR repeat protein